MVRAARLADVARSAGVSQGTASNVFNRPEIVRPEVRERVEAAARRLGYGGPDPRGRLLRAGKVNAIGVVTGEDTACCFSDPYLRLLLAGVAEVCDAHGAGVSLVAAQQQTEAGWRIQTALVDGFVLHGLALDERLVALATERGLPLASIDLEAGPGTSAVLIDDRGGAELAARHLLDLGHTRLALVAMTADRSERPGPIPAERLRASAYRFERERAAGWAAALARKGIALDAIPAVVAPPDPAEGARAVAALLEQHPEVTGVLAMSDALALATLEAARARGLRVPADLSVVGFDDVPEAAAAEPPLTTVAQPVREKGRLAARLVLEDVPPRVARLDVALVVRGSSAPPRR